MDKNSVKLIITGVILFILFIIALKILKSIVKALLPVAIIIIAASIVYKAVKRWKNKMKYEKALCLKFFKKSVDNIKRIMLIYESCRWYNIEKMLAWRKKSDFIKKSLTKRRQRASI